MKSVLLAIQPYYVFLIIARIMGWDITQEKTIEVRKDYPKDSAWDKITHIYCSKNRKSFNRIPKQYQPFMEKLLGKVIGKFVCDRIYSYPWEGYGYYFKRYKEACLTADELNEYGYKNGKYGLNRLPYLYGWHISDLKIYDKPKELGEFKTTCKLFKKRLCGLRVLCGEQKGICDGTKRFTIPPQSWCYIETYKGG